MARFKYLGDKQRFSFMVSGLTTSIALNQKDGTWRTIEPVAPATHFEPGEDLGHEITDERSIRQLQVDPRYEQIS